MIQLTPLQQELFDLTVGLDTICFDSEEIKADIITLNAAELRHNIKVFKDADAEIAR